mgnify:FL=1
MIEENKIIVKYIKENYADPINNNSKFAKECNIDEKTVRQIRSDNEYKIGLSTIIKICKGNGITLAEFFKNVGI